MATCPPLLDPSQVDSLRTVLSSITVSPIINSANATQDSDTVLALFCALVGSPTGYLSQCLGICPNSDVTGIGVRIANYVQIVVNVLLVLFSPETSNLTSWGSTLLTSAVVIPAIIQKRAGTLTVYHATQVFNFATVSTIANLAVSPMCTIWREKERGIIALPQDFDNDAGFAGTAPHEQNYVDKLRMAAMTTAYESRWALSLALIFQVGLQWSWAIYMFLSTSYSQAACNPWTVVVFFWAKLTVQEVNEKPIIFPLWLLFNMFLTLYFGIMLSFSAKQYPLLSPLESFNIRGVLTGIWSIRDGKKRLVLISNLIAVVYVIALVYAAELQVRINCVVLGESTTWGFGQVAAVLLSSAPLAGLILILRELIRKQKLGDHSSADRATLPLSMVESRRMMD